MNLLQRSIVIDTFSNLRPTTLIWCCRNGQTDSTGVADFPVSDFRLFQLWFPGRGREMPKRLLKPFVCAVYSPLISNPITNSRYREIRAPALSNPPEYSTQWDRTSAWSARYSGEHLKAWI